MKKYEVKEFFDPNEYDNEVIKIMIGEGWETGCVYTIQGMSVVILRKPL